MMFAKACDKLPLRQCQTNASAMLEQMRNISFCGKSGLIKLDSNEDLVPGSVAFKNYWSERISLRAHFYEYISMQRVLLACGSCWALA